MDRQTERGTVHRQTDTLTKPKNIPKNLEIRDYKPVLVSFIWLRSGGRYFFFFFYEINLDRLLQVRTEKIKKDTRRRRKNMSYGARAREHTISGRKILLPLPLVTSHRKHFQTDVRFLAKK